MPGKKKETIMGKFKIAPEIYEYADFGGFIKDFPIQKDDLILTQRFIYTPFIAPRVSSDFSGRFRRRRTIRRNG